MTYLVRLAIPGGRTEPDVVQVTKETPEAALEAARRIVMPGVEVTLMGEARA